MTTSSPTLMPTTCTPPCPRRARPCARPVRALSNLSSAKVRPARRTELGFSSCSCGPDGDTSALPWEDRMNTPFVSTDWLAQHLSDANLVIVDASWHMPNANRDPEAEYRAGHIP